VKQFRESISASASSSFPSSAWECSARSSASSPDGESTLADAKQSFGTCIPKRSLGTRGVCRFSVCLLGTLLLAVTPCRAAEAASEPPYQLTVVLDVAKSRVLTDIFRQQIEHELQEGLQAALGDLARVRVESDHPKLADVRARGLGRALDGWKERSEIKTHFVLIDLVNNQYEIQARQYDGPTCTASPVVRTDRTPDRAFVARTAALLIEQDFGFTATFASWPKVEDPTNQPQVVRLNLQGAGFGVPLSRWVKKNDVFSVVQMFSNGNAPALVPWALVQILDAPEDESPDASCSGRLFWRRTPPPEARGHAGYRCIKLGAIRAPVRLRLVQEKPGKIGAPLQAAIEVRRLGFRGEQGSVVTGGPYRGTGIFSTATMANVEPFDRVAFVTVQSGGHRAFVPLPLLDEQTVVVAMSAAGEKSDALAQRFDRWQRQVDDAWLVQVAAFQDLQMMSQKPGTPRDKIVKRAQAALRRTTDDYNRLSLEKDDLQHDAATRPQDLKRLEVVLQELKAGEKQLSDFVVKQEKILQEEDRPERRTAQAQIVDAQLAEEKAEYEQAIELYEKAKPFIDDPEFQKHLNNLESKWMPRDDAHKRARKFIYETWPVLDTVGLEREMENARKALAECKSANDTLAPRKLVLAARTHISRLTKEKTELHAERNEGDEKPYDRIVKVGPELEQLMRDALDYLGEKANK
jgi:hypothetical protein